MREIRSQIEIEAPVERVWKILTDFPAYPEWNPFIRSIRGVPHAGRKIEVHIRPPGRRGMTFNPTVLLSSKNRELRWLGHLLIPGLFDGEHRFVLEPEADGHTRFVQSERFSGLLAPLLTGMLSGTEHGFEEMNQALKRRAEAYQDGECTDYPG